MPILWASSSLPVVEPYTRRLRRRDLPRPAGTASRLFLQLNKRCVEETPPLVSVFLPRKVGRGLGKIASSQLERRVRLDCRLESRPRFSKLSSLRIDRAEIVEGCSCRLVAHDAFECIFRCCEIAQARIHQPLMQKAFPQLRINLYRSPELLPR